MRVHILAAALALPFAACTLGDITQPGPGGGGDDTVGGGDDVAASPDASVTPDFRIASMSPTQAATSLGTTTHYTLTLDSSNFSGPVTLAAAGAPASWNVTFSPSATVTVPMDGQATVDMVVAIPTDGDAGSSTLNITASGSPGERTATAQLAVANEYVITIADGTGTGAHPFFPQNLTLKIGVTLKIKDADTTKPHRIHSDGGAGFSHQDNDMAAGGEYDVTPSASGAYYFYCHDHGEGLGATNLTMHN
jgi:plastocyanin